jgi:hypothetical protein
MGWRMLVFYPELGSDMSKSTNTVVYFDWKTVIYIYICGKCRLAHAPVHVNDFPVVNVHVDELSSVRIWQYKLCATFSANVNINYRLPIKVYYRITLHTKKSGGAHVLRMMK